MSIVVKERSQYLLKSTLTGTERIIVNGSEYITPNQIAALAASMSGGGSGGGSGSVTSVGISVPTGFTVSGSPVTGSGIITIGYASGYSLPSSAQISNWNSAYLWVSANGPNVVSTDDLSDYQKKITSSNKISSSYVSGLAAVATSGSYTDLKNKPVVQNVVATDANNFSIGTQDYVIPTVVATDATHFTLGTQSYTIPTVEATSPTSFKINGTTYTISNIGDGYLPLEGGTITGNLQLKGAGNYGNRLIFGDVSTTNGPYVYLGEETDDILTIYAKSIKLVASNGSVSVNGTDIETYSRATTSALGLVKVAAVRVSSITATTGGTTSGRYYGVEMDSNGKLFVNVPWVSSSGSSGVSSVLGFTGAVTGDDILSTIGSQAPKIDNKKFDYPDDSSRNSEYLYVKHPATSKLTSGKWQFVLMVYSKNNRRRPNSSADPYLHSRRKKGWSVAMGSAGSNECVSTASYFETNTLKQYILRNYMIVQGKTASQMLSMSYATFKGLSASLRKGFGRTRQYPHAYKKFGIALRVQNPAFDALKTRTLTSAADKHRQDIDGVPRYIYSDITPLFVYVDADDCTINFSMVKR